MRQDELMIYDKLDGTPERLTEIGGKLYVTTPGDYNKLETLEEWKEENGVKDERIKVLSTDGKASAHLVFRMLCRALDEMWGSVDTMFRQNLGMLQDCGVELTDGDRLLLKVEVGESGRENSKYTLALYDDTCQRGELVYYSNDWEEKYEAIRTVHDVINFAQRHLFVNVETDWNIKNH